MYTIARHRSVGFLLSMLGVLLLSTTSPQAAIAATHEQRLTADIGTLHGLGPTAAAERESFKTTLRQWRKLGKRGRGMVREVVWEGTPELIIADRFDQQGKPLPSETLLMLHTKDAVLRVFPLTDLPDLRKGNLRMRVQGVAVGDRVLSESLSVSSVTATAAATATAAPPCQPTGPQRGLVIGVTYNDVAPTPNNSPTVLRDGFFGATNSVADYWDVVSYGKTTLTGNTVGWLKLPINLYADGSNTPHVCKLGTDGKYSFDHSLLETEALKAAANAVDITSKQSIDLTQYNRIFIAHDASTNGCSATGAAGLGGSCMIKNTPHGPVNASTSWDSWSGYFFTLETRIGIAMHEAGHNLGLGHADLLIFPDLSLIGPIGSLPPFDAYGDHYDVMGDLRGHFNAHHLFQIGWLTPDNVITTSTNGTPYLIEPISTRMNSPTTKKALRVFRGVDTSRITRTDPNTINKDYLWVETRSKASYDAFNPSGVSYAWGNALIHHEVKGQSGTLLVDMVPGGNSNDAPLLPYQHFYDPYGGITINHLGTTNDNLNVAVVFERPDTDTDGLPDAVEASYGANPAVEDTDGDRLTDLWEVCYDGDCSNYSPYPIGGDLRLDSQDTDGDGMLDKAEVDNGFNPIVPGQPPTITGFTPATGIPGTFITISGTNLPTKNGISISFHPGIPALIRQPISESQVFVMVPVGATTGPITISTFWGSVTSTTSFVIPALPTIASVSPASGPTNTYVVIQGVNLTGTSSITFNGVKATVFQNAGDTYAFAFVPSGATTGPVCVTTSGGTGCGAGVFTVIPVPTIASFSPASGPTNTYVVIQGVNLTGTSSITFNGVKATVFQNAGDTYAFAFVPSGATTGPVCVTTSGGTGCGAGLFTITP